MADPKRFLPKTERGSYLDTEVIGIAQHYDSHNGVGIGDLNEYGEQGEVVNTIEAKGQGIDAIQLELGEAERRY